MLKSILIVTCLLFVNFTYSQENFIWNHLDSINKTEAQLYSDTKLFIARYYNSAQDVIQNDDKEAGLILIKGHKPVYVKKWNGTLTYTYGYTVIFRFRDGKYKMTIENVHCKSTDWSSSNETPLCIEPFNNISEYDMCWGCQPKKTATQVMESLKKGLQENIDLYQFNIKKETILTDDW